MGLKMGTNRIISKVAKAVCYVVKRTVPTIILWIVKHFLNRPNNNKKE
ncbi:hypothetical protein ES708_23882 [subsurface metagenome]